MPDAPTTEGSIVAFLKLDDSDFVEKLDRAEQKARDLDRIDPRIQVEADTTDALARLEQIRMAESEVGGDRVIRTTTVNRTEDTTSTTENVARTVTDAGASTTESLARTAADAGAAANVSNHAVALLRDADAAQQATAAMDRLAPAEEAVSRVVELDAVQLSSHAEKARAAAEAALQLSGVEASSSGPVDEVAAARKRAVDALTAASGAADRASVAQKNLSDAQSMASDAADTYAHALQGLNDDIHNASLSGSRLQESYVFARESADVAAAASTALADAERDAAAASGEVEAAAGGAGDAVDGAGRKAAGAGKNASGGAGGFRILTGVIVGLIPTIAPLAGYVAGVSGALAGMGAAGVLAVLGIKNEMANGSDQGQQYADLMSTLQGDLHRLEDTAATGVLGPFSNMVGEIDGHMSQLDGEIGNFAGGLGGVGELVVATLVPGFQILNPLFEQGIEYVQRLIVEWQQWTVGGGLNQFAASAEQALPVVAADLGNLASIAMKLIVGLAPLGTTALQALEAVSGVLASLPTPVVFGMAAAVAAWFGEMSLWRTIQPLLTRIGQAFELLGADEEIALGPIGLVAAAVTALGIGVAGAAMSTQQASQDTQNYTVALQQSNGVIDENIRQTAAKNLQDQGVLDTALQYGLSLSTVTDAALGNVAAQQAVNNAIQLYGTYMKDVGRGKDDAVGTQQTALTSQAQKLADAVDGQSKSFNNATQAYKNIQAASLPVASAQSSLASQASLVSGALATQAGFATSLTNDLNLLNGISLNAVQTATAQAAALNSVSTSFKTNGKSITGTTSAAVANQQAIEQAVSAIDAHAEAVATATGSQDKGTQAIIAGRDALLRELGAQHELTPAVQTFIDTILQIPTQRNVNIAVNTVNAVNAVNSVSSLLAGLRSTTIDLNVVEHTYGVGVLGGSSATAPQMNFMHHASGGTVGGVGAAGIDSVPSLLAPSEEVISNMAGQADRYRGLLKTVNGNGTPQQVMAAARAETGLVGTGTTVNHYHTWHVVATDPEQVMQYMTAQTNRLAMV